MALAVFALVFLPVIPRLQYMFHTSGTHVFSEAPRLSELVSTLALRGLAVIFVVSVLVAAATRQLDLQSHLEGWPYFVLRILGAGSDSDPLWR